MSRMRLQCRQIQVSEGRESWSELQRPRLLSHGSSSLPHSSEPAGPLVRLQLMHTYTRELELEHKQLAREWLQRANSDTTDRQRGGSAD